MSANNASGNQPPPQPSAAGTPGAPIQPSGRAPQFGNLPAGAPQLAAAGAPAVTHAGAGPQTAPGSSLPPNQPVAQPAGHPAPAQPAAPGVVQQPPPGMPQPGGPAAGSAGAGGAAQPAAQGGIGPANVVHPAAAPVAHPLVARPLPADALTRCAEALSAFRAGRVNRHETIRQILAALIAAGGQVSDLGPYLEAIVQHEAAVRTAAAVGGAQGAGQAAAGGAEHAPGQQPAQPRAASPAQSDADRDAPGDDEHLDRRPAYNPRAAAFRDAISTRNVSPHVARTLDARANYCLDLKRAKYDLLRDGLAPPFPDDLWEAVLADRSVDFDRVLSARFSPHVSDRSTQQIGGADGPALVFGGARVTRKVANRADWEQCFTDWHNAVVFAYPHRSLELLAYRDLVHGLFDSLHHSRHGLILQADIAMRNEVALNRSFSFFDETRLARVHNRFTNAWGSAVNLATPGAESVRQSRRPTLLRADSSGEICNKFNDGHCGYSKCRRLHICRLCLKRDHSAKDHPDAIRRETEAAAGGRSGGRGGGTN